MSSTTSKGSGQSNITLGVRYEKGARARASGLDTSNQIPLQSILLKLRTRDESIRMTQHALKEFEGTPEAEAAEYFTAHAEVFADEASALDIHNLVLEGVATIDLLVLLELFDEIPKQDLLNAIGVSESTLQRNRHGRLGAEVASVALDLAAITEQADSVLGSLSEAQRWLTNASVALRGQTPLSLLSTRQGATLVRELLVRMEYGVYA